MKSSAGLILLGLAAAMAVHAKADTAGSPVVVLSPIERAAVRAGGLVTKLVETDDRSEVLSVAAIQTVWDFDQLLERARSPLGLRGAGSSLGEGRLHNPPAAADFASLRLDERDVEALAACRVGSCRVRLTALAISELRKSVDWSAPSRTEEVERGFRAMLAAEARLYLAHGQASLLPYGDGPNSRHRSEGLRELLRRSLDLFEGADDLASYLGSFPSGSFPSGRPHIVDEFLSWRQERFWRKPLIGLYHTVVWAAPGPGEQRLLVVSKQLYASHYYETALEVLEIRKATSETHAFVSFVSRVRADIRPSGFSWLERALLRRLVRGRLESQFAPLRERPEEIAGTRTRAAEGSLAANPGHR